MVCHRMDGRKFILHMWPLWNKKAQMLSHSNNTITEICKNTCKWQQQTGTPPAYYTRHIPYGLCACTNVLLFFPFHFRRRQKKYDFFLRLSCWLSPSATTHLPFGYKILLYYKGIFYFIFVLKKGLFIVAIYIDRDERRKKHYEVFIRCCVVYFPLCAVDKRSKKKITLYSIKPRKV